MCVSLASCCPAAAQLRAGIECALLPVLVSWGRDSTKLWTQLTLALGGCCSRRGSEVAPGPCCATNERSFVGLVKARSKAVVGGFWFNSRARPPLCAGHRARSGASPGRPQGLCAPRWPALPLWRVEWAFGTPLTAPP